MVIKRMASIITSLMIVLCCSCSSQNQAKNLTNATTGSSTSGENKPTITIQYFKGSYDIDKALMAFQYDNPEITIKTEQYEYDKTIDAFSNKQLLDLNTGEGPDVMIYEDFLFKSLYKVVDSGVFCDLNKMFESDKETNLADFYSNMFDCGVVNGSRYYVPLRVYCNLFYTTESILKNNNINIDYKHWTWKDMLQIFEQFSMNEKKSAKYLCNSQIYFDDIVSSFGKSFVDYKSKKSNFNSEEIKDALRAYKKLYKCAPEFDPGSIDFISDLTKALKSNYSVLYQSDFLSDPYSLLLADKRYRDDMNERLIVVPFPSWYGNGYQNSIPADLYSINSKCANKEYAYKLLKFLLAEDVQGLKDSEHNKLSFSYNTGYTVNKKAYLKDLKSIGTEIAEKINPEYRALPAVSVDNYKFIAENSDTRIHYDSRVRISLMSALNNYLKGKMTEDEALKRADEQIELFLNE